MESTYHLVAKGNLLAGADLVDDVRRVKGDEAERPSLVLDLVVRQLHQLHLQQTDRHFSKPSSLAMPNYITLQTSLNTVFIRILKGINMITCNHFTLSFITTAHKYSHPADQCRYLAARVCHITKPTNHIFIEYYNQTNSSIL